MHGSIFLGRKIDPDYMFKEFSSAIYAADKLYLARGSIKKFFASWHKFLSG